MSRRLPDPKSDPSDDHLQRRVPPAQRERRQSIAHGLEKRGEPRTSHAVPSNTGSYEPPVSNPSSTYEIANPNSTHPYRHRGSKDQGQTYSSRRDDQDYDTESRARPQPRDDRVPGDSGQDNALAYGNRVSKDPDQAAASIRDKYNSEDPDQVAPISHEDRALQIRALTRDSHGQKDSDQASVLSYERRGSRHTSQPHASTQTYRNPKTSNQALTTVYDNSQDPRSTNLTYTTSREDRIHEPISTSSGLSQRYQQPIGRISDEFKEVTGVPTLIKRDLVHREKPTGKPLQAPRKEAVKSPEDDLGDDDDDEPYPFTVLKDKIGQIFVKIEVSEHDERIDYLETNSELMHRETVDQTMKTLLKQAIDFTRMSKPFPATACILCLAMIRVSKDEKPLKPFFRRLGEQNSDEKEAYLSTVKAIQAIVTRKAREEGKLAPPRKKPKQPPPEDDLPTLKISEIFGKSIRSEYTILASDEPPVMPDDLSSKYQVRSNGRQFFCPGRVFGILWHEGTSKQVVTEDLMQPRQGDRTLSRGPYGQAIYSHFRRMVVVKTRTASCWCVSIGTYGGQGLCKKGLRQDEIKAHAIVHDSKKPAQYLKGEPRTDKRPIRVITAPGATLDVASRIHLGKPYCVEYNLKVMDVGRIHPDDLEVLIEFVKQELGLDS